MDKRIDSATVFRNRGLEEISLVYKLYVYKSSAYTEGALVIDIVNSALGSWKKDRWKDAERYIEKYDFSAMLSEMDITIPLNQDGTKKFKVHQHFSPNERNEYLAICSSYDVIMDIVDCIRGLAVKYCLTVYDPNLEKCYFPYEPKRERYVELKKREKELIKAVREGENPYSIIKIENCPSTYDAQISYAITIAKSKDTFENRVDKFAKMLSATLVEGENLYCMDGCFHIETSYYRISFIYEGYKKSADRIGFLDENNKPVVKIMYRMSSVNAWKMVPSLGYKDNYEFVYKSMRMEELVYKYPNPADRLIFIIKFQKRLRKFDGYAQYDPFHGYGGDVRMNKHYVDGFQDNMCCSYLKIEETFAMIFTPCVEKFYPYFKCRYYLTNNYLPDAMCHDILDETKNVRKMLAENPHSQESQQYLSEGNCSWMLKDEKDFWKAIGLMDIFIEWLELQFYAEEDVFRGYFVDITGP